MNYKVKIKSPNKIFTVKNRPIRTPFETIVSENGLASIKSRISFYGLSQKEFEITEIESFVEINKNEQKKEYSQLPSKQQIKEEKPTEDLRTTRIISSPNIQKSTVKPKQKIINNDKKTSYQKQEPQEIKKEELSTDFKKNSEQNINENIEVNNAEVNRKSKTILEKFLNSEF